MNKQFLLNSRTDLAIDVAMINDDYKTLLKEEIKYFDNLKVVKHIVSEQAKSLVGKECGTYYLIDFSDVNYHDMQTQKLLENTLKDVLIELLKTYNLIDRKVLIVGLGNENVTPDAFGPYTCDHIIVTRHLDEINKLHRGYGIVSAIAPGVMGSTGIESYDIIDAIRQKIDVDYIIVIDALATSSMSRLNKTIQITDSGIAPGSGVGNKRKEISFKTQKIPVIAIGVPTVVDASSMVTETIEILSYLTDEEISMKGLNKLSFKAKQDVLKEVLSPNGYNMMVTSKDVDQEVEDLAKIVAWGINKAVHKKVSDE